MPEVFKMKILDIQPSQLFISEKKLKDVLNWLDGENIQSYEPVPVKELNGKVIFTDGHTRAYALYKMGIEDILCFWDNDNLDWEAYQICVDWCIEEGITNISHLEQKVVDHNTYEVLWHDRCRKMQRELDEKRRKLQNELE